jgi:hypothetical protein
MSKQTATDYLIQEIKNDSLVQAKSTQEWNEVFQKAKEMEREQIIDAFGIGCQVESTRLVGYHDMANQHYNETYRDKK